MTISGRTAVYAVLGDPVAHSLSPRMHNAWIAEHELDAVYVALRARSEGYAGLGHIGLAGANVTAPHKELAARVADRLSPEAATLSAVNTLRREQDGAWSGINTDAEGFVLGLDDAAPDWQARVRSALVLGAGGAARAVAYGLASRGCQVQVANRTYVKAQAMAGLGPGIEAAPWDVAMDLATTSDLIVNAVSPGVAESTLTGVAKRAKAGALACDIVYKPLLTPFLTVARGHGLTIVDGLHMLVGQGALAFQHWFGRSPNRATARARLLETIGESAP